MNGKRKHTKGRPRPQPLSDKELNKGLRTIRTQMGLVGLKGDLGDIPRSRKLKIFNKYRPIAEGRATVVKLKKDIAEEYGDAHLKGIVAGPGGRVMVENRLGYDRAQIAKGSPLVEGKISHRKKLKKRSLESLTLPFPVHNIEELLDRLESDPELDELKAGRREQWTFSFEHDGEENFTEQQFQTLRGLAEFLRHYQSIQRAAGDDRKGREILQALRIVRNYDAPQIEKSLKKSRARKKALQQKKDKLRARYRKLRRERGG